MFYPTYNRVHPSSCDCDEVDRLREENERMERQEQERREALRAEAKERREAYQRSARDWREALDKQASLYAREAGCYPDLDEEGVDSFAIASEACKKAAGFWDEIEASKQPEIDELEAKIAALRNSIRLETCAKVREFYANQPGEQWVESFVTSSLEEGEDPEDWLNW